MSAKKTITKKVAAKKAAKPAPKKTVAKKTPAKKAVAKKAVAKKAPVKKVAAKKVPAKKEVAAKKPAVAAKVKPAPPGSQKKESSGQPPAKPAKPPAPSSNAPISAPREVNNGVRQPVPSSIAGKLWAIADDLKAKLGRDAARFEFRAAVAGNSEPFDPASVSFNWFQWRKFNGVVPRASGLNAKRGTFEVNDKPKRAKK